MNGMIRLKKLQISGFRGARYPIVTDLTGSGKSIAIFGENATGKSTITDAIEWFFRDRVEHLWREDCKEDSLRNVDIDDKEDAVVGLVFNRDELSGEKILRKKGENLIVEETNKTKEYKDYIGTASQERIVLRTAYLQEFINKRKGEKRKEIADIIGYEALIDFRNVLQSTLNALEKDTEYTTAKKNLDTVKAKLLKLSGKVITKEQELYTKANDLIKIYKLKTTVIDEKSYKESIEELKTKIAQHEKAERKQKLDSFKTACDDLKIAVQNSQVSESKFLDPYRKLIRNKEKIKHLDLEQFLSKGKEILDKGQTEPSKCPFCGSSPVDLEHVKKEVEKRIQELKAVRKEFLVTKSAKDDWVSDLNEVDRRCRDLERKWKSIDVASGLAKCVPDCAISVKSLVMQVEDRFQKYQSIPDDGDRKTIIRKLITAIGLEVQTTEKKVKALELTKEESAILDTIQSLNDLKTAFADYRGFAKAKKSFEKQLKTLDKIKENFISVQNEAFQNILDVMSKDIRDYYLYLHPPKHESVDDVKLRIVGEEGIEFEYLFHGKRTYPPMKYLSESHLNSLGLALFLASVKLFNEESNFFVLDDVVTSFDAGHRLRLIRLLQEKFKDWQIILLTHERFWFDMIKKELAATGWIIKEVNWSPENGIQLKAAASDLRELISFKLSQGHDVANDMRTLLEKLLKEICNSLEVKLAFRYNDRNEERMVGELLSELRRTLNEKNTSIKDNPIFKQIETSNLLGTTGSHDRPKTFSKGDIGTALEDIDKFEALFRCPKCGVLVSKERFIEIEKKVTCKCGSVSIDWKG